MKIEISDKAYEFLKEFVQEVDAQDNRATAKPYFYVIKDEETQAVPDGCGDETRYVWDGDTMTKEDVMLNLDSEQEFESMLDSGDIYTIDVVERNYTPENHNIFFTEKACHAHMKQNSHHFKKPMSYVRHAWRNPEIEGLMDAVREVVEGKISVNPLSSNNIPDFPLSDFIKCDD